MNEPYYLIEKTMEKVASRLQKRDLKFKNKWRGPCLTVSELMLLHDQRKHWRYDCYEKLNPSTGKKRLICAPIDAVKFASQDLAKALWEPFKVDLADHVHAYVEDRSHITNALAHVGSKEILEIDIQAAFPSVTHRRIIQNLKDYTSGPVATFIAGMVCVKGRLAQGNPLAPLIFLIVTRPLARKLASLAKRYGLTFTIYSDNITFSGAKLPRGLEDEVDSLIRLEGFEPHPHGMKHRRMGGNSGRLRIVTGLKITASGLALPKEKREQARAAIERALSPEFFNSIQEEGKSLKRTRESLIGKIGYAVFMDPIIKQELRKRLHDLDARQLLRKNLRKDRAKRLFRWVEQKSMRWEACL